MAVAEWFLTRWALVELLWKGHATRGNLLSDGSTSEYVQSLLLRLAQDDHPSVRAEARWRPRQLQAERSAETPDLSTDEALNEPDPSFFKLKLNVGNFLAFSGRRDYDAELVERVTVYLHEHPMTLGYDIEAYWSAFTTGQASDASQRFPWTGFPFRCYSSP